MTTSTSRHNDIASVTQFLWQHRHADINPAFRRPEHFSGLEVKGLELGPHLLWGVFIFVRKFS